MGAASLDAEMEAQVPGAAARGAGAAPLLVRRGSPASAADGSANEVRQVQD